MSMSCKRIQKNHIFIPTGIITSISGFIEQFYIYEGYFYYLSILEMNFVGIGYVLLQHISLTSHFENNVIDSNIFPSDFYLLLKQNEVNTLITCCESLESHFSSLVFQKSHFKVIFSQIMLSRTIHFHESPNHIFKSHYPESQLPKSHLLESFITESQFFYQTPPSHISPNHSYNFLHNFLLQRFFFSHISPNHIFLNFISWKHITSSHICNVSLSLSQFTKPHFLESYFTK
jgi:hypothetical protein